MGRPAWYDQPAYQSTDRDAYQVAGRLQVECWCHAKVVWVRQVDVMAGLTGTCGRDGCDPHMLGY